MSILEINDVRFSYRGGVEAKDVLRGVKCALENIIYPMELCHIEKQQAKSDAKKLADMVALPESLLDRYPGKISGGEQQRVAIARALDIV